MLRCCVLPPLVAVLVASLAGAAEKPRPMTVDDIMQIRNIGDVQLSPDGQHVVYSLAVADFKDATYNSDLWLLSLQGGKPIKLTNARKRNDSPRWSPDGKSIAFLSDRAGKPQVWIIPLQGGEARKVTDLPQGVRECEWSPDGKSIAFLAVDGETEEEKKRKEEKTDVLLVDHNIKKQRLYLVDLATSKTRKVNTGQDHVVDVDWSPDGTRIAFTHQPTPSGDDVKSSQISLAVLDTDDVKTLVKGDGSASQPRWSRDGKRIAFLARGSDWIRNNELRTISAEGGRAETISAQFDEIIGHVTAHGFDWSKDGKTIYFVAEQKTGRALFALNLADGKVKQCTNPGSIIHRFSLTQKTDAVAVAVEAVGTPIEVGLWMPGNERVTTLTETNPQLKDIALGQMEVVRWKGQDNQEIEGVLLKPVGYKKDVKYPLIVYVHGGPSMNFRLALTPYGMNPQTQRYPLHVLAGEGYAILCPNPRGSTGYGEKFRRANIKDWGGADLQDVLLGVDEMVKRGIADENRLGIMGWSYGGFMTSWAITQTDRFKAASVGAGVTHPTGLFGLTDIPSFMVDYYGGTPWDAPDNYFRCSAVQHAGKVKTPTLIQHGEKDERVPLAQGQEFYAALKYRKVPVEFVIYPRSGHHVTEPKLQADVMQRNVDWFNRWLKK